MRFSAVQEVGFGADSGQNRLPNDVDESMMASIGDSEPGGGSYPEEGSMISNLPLLFADGYPISLEKITLPQLERFITFMVQCSFGHDTAMVTGEPQWWPKEVKFSNPFVRPKKVNENWMGNLKKLVFRCYTYHRSEYLLRFCSYLSKHPHDKLQYVNNWDSTTSLYHTGTGKLLVTFRNENMNYDKKVESPRRLLLPRNGVMPGSASKVKQQPQRPQIMVQPLCDDIYLCDNCDAELVGLEKMKEHEKICCYPEQTTGSSRPVSPEDSIDKPQTAQYQFLEYFKLSSNEQKSKPAAPITTATTAVGSRSSRRIRGSVNLARCPTIPFSSPAGIAMAKKLRTMTEGTQQERLDRLERYMSAPSLNQGSRPRWLDRVPDFSRWVVTYKPNRDKPPKDDYVHEYNFNSFKGKPMLSIRSQVLCMACPPVSVPITLLTPKQIEELKHTTSENKCPAHRGPRSKPRSTPKTKSNLSKPSLKRKNPGDENDPIVIDDEELATLTPIGSDSPFSGIPSITQTDDLSIASCTQITAPNIENDSSGTANKKNNSIMYISLCSSDEEDSNGPTTCDENRDPMGATNPVLKSYLSPLTPSKFCASSCVYPADSTSDWVHRTDSSVLNEDSDNCGNKYLGGVALRARTRFSPVLRSTP